MPGHATDPLDAKAAWLKSGIGFTLDTDASLAAYDRGSSVMEALERRIDRHSEGKRASKSLRQKHRTEIFDASATTWIAVRFA